MRFSFNMGLAAVICRPSLYQSAAFILAQFPLHLLSRLLGGVPVVLLMEVGASRENVPHEFGDVRSGKSENGEGLKLRPRFAVRFYVGRS
jgi:hypothetical protein